MKLDYAILSLFVGLVYAVVKKYLPDFPVTADVILGLLVYTLSKLGVEIVKPAAARLLGLK